MRTAPWEPQLNQLGMAVYGSKPLPKYLSPMVIEQPCANPICASHKAIGAECDCAEKSPNFTFCGKKNPKIEERKLDFLVADEVFETSRALLLPVVITLCEQQSRKQPVEGALDTGAIMRKWVKGQEPLTAYEQKVVNDVGDGQHSFSTVRVLNPRERLSTPNPFERLRGSKHADSNLAKIVQGVVPSQVRVREEPESSVGSSLPKQWRPMVVEDSEEKYPGADHCLPVVPEHWEDMSVSGTEGSESDGSQSDDGCGTYKVLKKAKKFCDTVGYHERRVIVVEEWEEFPFAELDFIGKWNGSRFSSSQSLLCVEHTFGFHFHARDMTVKLPKGLVDELKDFWTSRERDVKMENFNLCVARSRVLTSEMILTPKELYESNLYAPAIAFIESWDAQQNVTRVTQKRYAHGELGKSVRKTVRALKTKEGMLFASAVVAVGVCVAYGYYKIRTVLAHRKASRIHAAMELSASRACASVGAPYWDGKFSWNKGWSVRKYLPKIRLVGIELNPGPGIMSKQLVNCIDLPLPKALKDGAKMGLRHLGLRKEVERKGIHELRGKHVVLGFDTKRYSPTAFASNQHNEKQALLARVLADTVTPDDTLDECINWCKVNHEHLFPNMHHVQSVPFPEYLRRSNASPSVKRQLQAAKIRLDAEGIGEYSSLTRSQLHRYTTRSSFVKVENDLYESPAGRKHKAPRLIQGAQPEFIVLVGPWIMALQDLLKRRWNPRKSNLVFTSGVSAEQAAEFISGGAGPWVEDDLGKFDCSIRRPWCEYEVWLARRFGAPKCVLELMQANINTHGSTLHGWRYKCDGTRKSGDPYTSLFNSVINVVSHLFLYCKWTKKSVLQARNSIRMLAQGDDNCLRHLEWIEFPWQAGMAGLGFDSEALYRRRLDQVEFCSCRIYETQEGVVFGPKPGRVLAKLGYVVNPPVNVSQQSMMRGIALGLERACSYIPPLNAVVQKVISDTEGHKAWVDAKKARFEAFEVPIARKTHKACLEVMCNLDMNYQWDYGKQRSLESTLINLRFGDEMKGNVELLFDRDTGGPQVIFGAWHSQPALAPCA